MCYRRPERGGRELRVQKERNCNQVIVVVNCSVCCAVEQKRSASLIFICTVFTCGFCVWGKVGQIITVMFPGQAVLSHLALAWFLDSSA